MPKLPSYNQRTRIDTGARRRRLTETDGEKEGEKEGEEEEEEGGGVDQKTDKLGGVVKEGFVFCFLFFVFCFLFFVFCVCFLFLFFVFVFCYIFLIYFFLFYFSFRFWSFSFVLLLITLVFFFFQKMVNEKGRWEYKIELEEEMVCFEIWFFGLF